MKIKTFDAKLFYPVFTRHHSMHILRFVMRIPFSTIERSKLKRFRIFLLTLSIHVSCQRDLLVDAIADFALVLAVILQSDVLDLQVGADYLIALPANKDKNN